MRIAIAALVTACGFHGPVVGVADGDTATIVDDTTADFADGAPDGETAIEPHGLLEPAAYVLGGLHALAYTGRLFDSTKTTFDSITGALAGATLLGSGYAQVPDDWGTNRPFGLGLPMSGDMFTIAYTGQIHLTAGAHSLTVMADDAGIVEIDVGTGFAAANLSAPRDGWYPIRAAIAEGSGDARLAIKLDGIELTGASLRARVNDATGILASVYAGAANLKASSIAVPGVDQDYGMLAPPYDAPMVTAASYIVRFAGQVFIAADGAHAFAATLANGFDQANLWVDRHLVARAGTATLVTLAPGWHGFGVDFLSGQSGNPHDASLRVLLDGQPITNTALRPAATTGVYVQLASGGPTDLNDLNEMGGATTLALTALPALPPSPLGTPQTIDSIDLGWFEMGGSPTDYTATAILGALAPIALPALAPVFNLFGSFLLADERLRDQVPPPGAWRIQVQDTVQGGGKGVAQSFANISLHGGPAMPFAPHWVYTSPQHPTPGAIALGPITMAALLDGATAKLEVRTTADDTAWVGVASGGTPATDPGDFIQYRITVDGDGWQYPTIDRVAIDYVVPRS